MENSWFKTHRKIIYSDVFINPHLLQLWIYCLSQANYAYNEYMSGNKLIKLKPGQFMTGRRKLAIALQINENTAYKRLQTLKAMGMIQLNSNRIGTIVTIVNWGKYQGDADSGNNKSNNISNNKRNKNSNTTKEIKKEKKEKKNNTPDLPEKEMTEEEEFEMRAREFERLKANGTI